MCGILGYIGKTSAIQVLIEGLKRLEYRGYDSAGLIVQDESGEWQSLKKVGRVENLSKATTKTNISGSVGISHTRWATHGQVNESNTHPHFSHDGKISIVHNGVIENYLTIKNFLKDKGFTFYSDTDSEVLANLIAYHYSKYSELNGSIRLLESVRKTLSEIKGTYGMVVLCKDLPNEMIGVRKSSPLILGIGKDEYFLASDVSAFSGHTREVVFLSDDEIVHVTNEEFKLQDTSNSVLDPVIEKIDWDINFADLGNFNHYMQKEIFEQPLALENTMRGRFSKDGSSAHFGGLSLTPQELRHVDRILFLACGTAWHACLMAEYLIEKYARIPVEVEYASEFRYRNAPLDKNTLVFVVSQSGETIDTLAALREASRKGYHTLAISNVVGSTIARESDGGIYQRSGPEIGVASTKAFTGQVCIATMLALYFGRLRDMSFSEGVALAEALKNIPNLVKKALKQEGKIKEIAKKYAKYNNFLFLGRQSMFPVALEGALKLKEISYIHAEGYPAAELKHGPIALVDENCPSVFLNLDSAMFDKTVSNMQEVKARGGPIIAISSEKKDLPENLADDTIIVPSAHEAVMPILGTVPLQLLSYYVALERGCDVDRPRNLAKSVTVE